MNYQIVEITDAQFLRLGELISKKFGIKLPINKRIMFQSRLQPRLTTLGMNSFESYCNYFFQPENTLAELSAMIDLVSTNKTEFFRENTHFDLLLNQLLPEIVNTGQRAQDRLIRCWSAGCSTGQEAFSLAMILEDFKLKTKHSIDYHILGTDVSTRVLDVARLGIYPFSQASHIPEEYLKRYVLKSKNQLKPQIKIMKAIQVKTDFRYANLMDERYSISQMFRLIFIRNTLIYFNMETQYLVLKKILEKLQPGGFLFIGHSESLINMNLPISMVAPSVYRKDR